MPKGEERRDCSTCDREVVPDGELGSGLEQFLDLHDGLDERIRRPSAVDKQGTSMRENLSGERVNEETHAGAVDRVFRE